MKTSTRTLALVCASLIGLAAVAETADARPRPSRGKRFQANKGFGLGIMLGAPTGFSAKYYYSADRAFDFGLGAIGYYRGRDGLHLHFDHLWHPLSLASVPEFELPLYAGIGARFFDFDDDDNRDGSVFGVRGPVGLAFDFNNVPLDIFFELALILDFYVDDPYDDDVDVDLNAAIGLRYYFN